MSNTLKQFVGKVFVVWVVGRIVSDRSVSKIIIIISLSFRVGTFKNNIDHRDRETCVIFGLPIHNKNSAINGLLPFFFDFTSYRKDRFLGNK